MTDTIADAMPWPQSERREQATDAETTQGRTEETRWVVVGLNLNPAEAAIIKARLDSEEIPAIVQQEAIGSVFGLTVGPLGSAKVLVPEPLVEKALDILSETFEIVDEAEYGDNAFGGDEDFEDLE